VITDLAVAPDDTIYVISYTAIYTADPTDGHVTRLGSLSACGSKGVALTTTPDGEIWTGDFSGALCRIDVTTTPPEVAAPVMMDHGMALAGDLVATGDGTVFGTAYKLSDGANEGTQASNVLVRIDLATGVTTLVSPMAGTGYPKLFGTSFAENSVIGFTHDRTGNVIKIDPATGAASIFATFTDPGTGEPISFAGAGVNSLVPIQ
jgi:streptogramin lyase